MYVDLRRRRGQKQDRKDRLLANVVEIVDKNRIETYLKLLCTMYTNLFASPCRASCSSFSSRMFRSQARVSLTKQQSQDSCLVFQRLLEQIKEGRANGESRDMPSTAEVLLCLAPTRGWAPDWLSGTGGK